MVVTDAADNCTASPLVAFVSEVNNGGTGCTSSPLVIMRTYSVTDECNNFTDVVQTITVENTLPPVIGGCPSATTFECSSDIGADINAWLVNAEADILAASVGTCNGLLTVSNDFGTVPMAGCNMSTGLSITFTVTDVCGGTTDCSVNIFVDDNTNPSISCAPGTVSYTHLTLPTICSV